MQKLTEKSKMKITPPLFNTFVWKKKSSPVFLKDLNIKSSLKSLFRGYFQIC